MGANMYVYRRPASILKDAGQVRSLRVLLGLEQPEHDQHHMSRSLLVRHPILGHGDYKREVLQNRALIKALASVEFAVLASPSPRNSPHTENSTSLGFVGEGAGMLYCCSNNVDVSKSDS